MGYRHIILFLLISLITSSCFNADNNKKYAITTYFISFDSSSDSKGKEGQKFKYSYEEYNADSNLIYQELYATPNSTGNMWGKLLEKTKFFYSKKEKIKAERQFGIAYRPNERGTNIYTYKYDNGNLIEWLSDGKPLEQYRYDNQKHQIEKRMINALNIPAYEHFIYANGLKIKSQSFVSDTIASIDTFVYDRNRRLIEKFSFDNKGQVIGHRLYMRNGKGQVVEAKWREPYGFWRMRNDGKIIEDEFYQVNKYFYDGKGRQVKTEFYDVGNLTTIYEFEYN